MKSSDSAQLLQKIDDAIGNIKSFQGLSRQATVYFAQFLVVYICGIYEEIIESTVVEMVSKLGKQEVVSFTKKTLGWSFRNPNTKAIKDLFNKFENPQWITTLDGMSGASKSALNSIVENKNALAHGTSPLNLTVMDVENYYNNSRQIIEKIDDLLLG